MISQFKFRHRIFDTTIKFLVIFMLFLAIRYIQYNWITDYEEENIENIVITSEAMTNENIKMMIITTTMTTTATATATATTTTTATATTATTTTITTTATTTTTKTNTPIEISTILPKINDQDYINNSYINDAYVMESLKNENANIIKAKHPEKIFRVMTEHLKKTYYVSEKLRIIIEHQMNKISPSFFRVQVLGDRIFSPQQVTSQNLSRFIFEAPLMDPGSYSLQVRLIFYNYLEIFTLETKIDPEIPNINSLDKFIVNGDNWNFTVESQDIIIQQINNDNKIRNSCSNSNTDILTGRWDKDLKSYYPYKCNIPKYKDSEFPKLFQKQYYRYNWIRFLGDSNTQALFQLLYRSNMGNKIKCNRVHKMKDVNDIKNRRITYFCTLPYSDVSTNYEKDDPRPKELILTYEWYFPSNFYNLENLLKGSFEDVCKPCEKCRLRSRCKFDDNDESRICTTKHADYTFISIGSHTPEWNETNNDKYLNGIFNHIQNYYSNRKFTFSTTNAVDIHKIPKRFKRQYLIRNEYRIARNNDLLRNYVRKSIEQGYENIDLLDIFSTSQPIWEFSKDAVHYNTSLYNIQAQLVIDKLLHWLEKQNSLIYES
ncbi:hypothetical protein Glove_146g57 [Diversispora epigaea]|uniref:Uncharacterized protein n=1 Tax=Diversispora epigaea TaxID=1348612 RepID=A0A397J2W3_9GLOM|nr:hypothetical protein Glove_146g57 [Diversispora epigaea]